MHLMFQGLRVSPSDGFVTAKWKIWEKLPRNAFHFYRVQDSLLLCMVRYKEYSLQ